MSVLIAYDSSGSTNYEQHYHRVVQQLTEEYRNHKNLKIISWNSEYKEITFDELRKINQSMCGSGGTAIQLVAEYIITTDFKGKLVLITDGAVAASDIQTCDQYLRHYDKLDFVDVFIIGHYANMSVSCPFTRLCPHKVNTYISGHLTETVEISPKDIMLLDKIDTLTSEHEFLENYDSIHKALTARMMGKTETDQNIHDKLVKLKNKFQEEQSKAKSNQMQDKIAELSSTYSISTYQNIINSYYYTSSNDIESKFNELFNITKGGLKSTFCHRLRRADEIQKPEIDELVLTKLDEPELETFECPITCEDELDVVILIKEAPALMHLVEPHQFDDILNCPLNALNYKQLTTAITDTFDLAVGLQALQQAQNINHPITRSPLTRSPLQGGIFLGANKSQAQATNHTIAKMICGLNPGGKPKKIGNMNLWYAVIYFLLQNHHRFQDITQYARQHMKWRLQNTTAWASLTGLPQYLNVRVPLGLACWMVTASPLLNLPSKRDMMRAHVFHLDELFHLTALYEAPIDERCQVHGKRLVALYKLLSICKKDKRRLDMMIRALYQNCDNYIPLDGPAEEDQVTQVLQDLKDTYNLVGTKEELVSLHQLVNPNLSAGDIPLSLEFTPTNLQYAIEWEYGLSRTTIEGHHPICPKTMRPFYYVKDKTWKDEFISTYKTDKVFSGHECYIRYVNKYNKYPSVEELINYLYEYHCVNRNYKCLPAPVNQFANEIVEECNKHITDVPVEEFIRITNASMCIADRIKMESS
jgi:hypothetical protein